jgi:hypothetical protein
MEVLGWSREPSAAFWGNGDCMYHALYLAGHCAYAVIFREPSHIPPILSCGSTSSLGSGNTHLTDRPIPFDKEIFDFGVCPIASLVGGNLSFVSL